MQTFILNQVMLCYLSVYINSQIFVEQMFLGCYLVQLCIVPNCRSQIQFSHRLNMHIPICSVSNSNCLIMYIFCHKPCEMLFQRVGYKTIQCIYKHTHTYLHTRIHIPASTLIGQRQATALQSDQKGVLVGRPNCCVWSEPVGMK